MAAEDVPLSVESDGNLRITAVAWADDPKSAADLNGGDDLTYSLKIFNRSVTEAVVEDPRLTLRQQLRKRGKVTEDIEIQYVFGDDADVAQPLLTAGTQLHISARYSVPNATSWTAAQIADVLHVECGEQRKDAPVENGVQTITQTLYTIQATELDATIAA